MIYAIYLKKTNLSVWTDLCNITFLLLPNTLVQDFSTKYFNIPLQLYCLSSL